MTDRDALMNTLGELTAAHQPPPPPPQPDAAEIAARRATRSVARLRGILDQVREDLRICAERLTSAGYTATLMADGIGMDVRISSAHGEFSDSITFEIIEDCSPGENPDDVRYILARTNGNVTGIDPSAPNPLGECRSSLNFFLACLKPR